MAVITRRHAVVVVVQRRRRRRRHHFSGVGGGGVNRDPRVNPPRVPYSFPRVRVRVRV